MRHHLFIVIRIARGPNIIEETENYKHLGVNCNKYTGLKVNLKEAADKLKGTFLSLVHCGLVDASGLHPLSCKKLYCSVVLPKALYGCEVWYNLNETDILLLERAHRYCVKYMQNLRLRCRTDVALSLLGIWSLESEINYRKLILFGQFCRLNSEIWVKNVFLVRLDSFSTYGQSQEGFISDIVRLLEQYALRQYLDQYLLTGHFPSKYSWKREIRSKINSHEVGNWYNRISAPEFSRFRCLHSEFKPCELWVFSKKKPTFLPQCRSVVQMMSNLVTNNADRRICRNCNKVSTNIIDHCISECYYVQEERLILWENIFHFDHKLFAILGGLSNEVLSLVLLGAQSNELAEMLQNREEIFQIICIVNLHRVWMKFTSYATFS